MLETVVRSHPIERRAGRDRRCGARCHRGGAGRGRRSRGDGHAARRRGRRDVAGRGRGRHASRPHHGQRRRGRAPDGLPGGDGGVGRPARVARREDGRPRRCRGPVDENPARPMRNQVDGPVARNRNVASRLWLAVWPTTCRISPLKLTPRLTAGASSGTLFAARRVRGKPRAPASGQGQAPALQGPWHGRRNRERIEDAGQRQAGVDG